MPKLVAIDNWVELNNALRGCTEEVAAELLAAERAGKKRKQFLNRIHSRLNKVRADNERARLAREAAR